MAITTTTVESARQVALASIHVPDNVRALDDEHVKALAGSIELQGMLVPIVVRADGDGSSWSPAFTASPPRARSA